MSPGKYTELFFLDEATALAQLGALRSESEVDFPFRSRTEATEDPLLDGLVIRANHSPGWEITADTEVVIVIGVYTPPPDDS